MSKDILHNWSEEGLNNFLDISEFFNIDHLIWGLADPADKARNLFTINKMM